MIKIKTGKDNKFYMSVHSTNGNEIAHTSKGYDTLAEIMSIVETLRAGKVFSEIETANIAIKGNAVYFKAYNTQGETIMVSGLYQAQNGANPRNAWVRANTQAVKGYTALLNPKYLAKIEIL